MIGQRCRTEGDQTLQLSSSSSFHYFFVLRRFEKRSKNPIIFNIKPENNATFEIQIPFNEFLVWLTFDGSLKSAIYMNKSISLDTHF